MMPVYHQGFTNGILLLYALPPSHTSPPQPPGSSAKAAAKAPSSVSLKQSAYTCKHGPVS